MYAAFWLLRNVMSSHGGPVARLSCTKREDSYLGTSFDSYCTLVDGLIPARPYKLYGHAHGMGTDAKSLVANWKAISEAFERAALWHARNSPQLGNQVGLPFEDSSTGFAAYPELSASRCREHAALEALERWTLQHWWESELPCKQHPASGDVNAIEILVPFSKGSVAVVWTVGPDTLAAYGFAAGVDFNAALAKAKVELSRNRRILNLPVRDRTQTDLPLAETRLLFFASSDGQQLFRHKIAETSLRTLQKTPPELTVDCEVKGFWSKYVKVWRCLYAETTSWKQKNLESFYF